MAEVRVSQVIAQVEYTPAGDEEYYGYIPLSVSVEAVTSAGHYVGDIPLSVSVEAVTSYENPLRVRGTGGFEFGGAGDIGFPETFNLVGSGGFELGGDGDPAFEDPSEFTLEGSGGFAFGGAGEITFEDPTTFTLVGSGGFEFNGEGTVVFAESDIIVGTGGFVLGGDGDPTFEDPDIYNLVGSGGFKLGGAGVIAFVVLPSTYYVTGTGGFKFSGDSTIAFVTPETFNLTGTGGFEFGGEGVIVYIVPDEIFNLIGTGGFEFTGAGRIVFLAPDAFSLIGSGGLVFGGEGSDEEYLYHTWVFSGGDLKPSIYGGYNFNSYCEHGDKYYGANSDGIYELTGGTDDGDTIHTGLKIGPTNLGLLYKKKLRSIYLGACNQDAKAKIEIGRENLVNTGYFSATNGKLAITRDLYGEEITLNITDFDEISLIEIIPVIQSSRGK